MVLQCVVVGVGGALGAIGRYLFGLIPVAGVFPLTTLCINGIGAILIGFVTVFLGECFPMHPNMLLFWKTGVCGGFTTFSTFSLETVQLLGQGKYWVAGAYAVLSVILCLAGVFLGFLLGKVSAAALLR